MDIYTTALIIAAMCCISFILYHKFKLDSKAISAQATPKGKNNAPIFEGISLALNEMNKIGEEQAKIAKGLGMSDENIVKLTNPVRDRYNKLKWVKDNEQWSVPLLNFSQQTINKLIKGFEW